MSWQVIVSNLCINTSNIGRKIMKIGKQDFVCVCVCACACVCVCGEDEKSMQDFGLLI